MILYDKREIYNKVGLCNQHGNNVKFFNKFCHAKINFNQNIFKCTYFGKNDHNASHCFNKNHDMK